MFSLKAKKYPTGRSRLERGEGYLRRSIELTIEALGVPPIRTTDTGHGHQWWYAPAIPNPSETAWNR